MTENSPFITHPPSLYFSGFCDKTEPPEFPEQNESRKSPVLHRRPERPGFPIPENILFLSGSELLLFPAPTAGRKKQEAPDTELQPARSEDHCTVFCFRSLWQRHKEPSFANPDPFSATDTFFFLFFLYKVPPFVFQNSLPFQFLPYGFKRNDRRLFFHMLPDMLFHPYHVVPPFKFISALKKLSNHPVSKFFVKMHTVQSQVFVLLLRICDTGIQIQNMLCSQRFLQGSVQLFADSMSLL